MPSADDEIRALSAKFVRDVLQVIRESPAGSEMTEAEVEVAVEGVIASIADAFALAADQEVIALADELGMLPPEWSP